MKHVVNDALRQALAPQTKRNASGDGSPFGRPRRVRLDRMNQLADERKTRRSWMTPVVRRIIPDVNLLLYATVTGFCEHERSDLARGRPQRTDLVTDRTGRLRSSASPRTAVCSIRDDGRGRPRSRASWSPSRTPVSVPGRDTETSSTDTGAASNSPPTSSWPPTPSSRTRPVPNDTDFGRFLACAGSTTDRSGAAQGKEKERRSVHQVRQVRHW
jgi:hypothetical protein